MFRRRVVLDLVVGRPPMNVVVPKPVMLREVSTAAQESTLLSWGRISIPL
jgi:hypothetical protein